MARKMSTNQIEYNKQIARIQRHIKNLEKQGYIFDENIIGSKPKRITQNKIKELKRITPTYLKSHAVLDTELDVQQFVKQNVKPKGKKVAKEIKGNVKVDKYTAPQEIEPPVTTTSPDAYDIFDRITDIIEAIPNVIGCRNYATNTWEFYPWQQHYNLMGVFIKSMQEADKNGTTAELAQYYEANEVQLSNALNPGFMPSDLTGVEHHFDEAIKILNVGEVLTMKETVDLGMVE